MSDWQPIETAPKDGTEILAWTSHELQILAWTSHELQILWWSERLNGWTFNDDWEVDDPTHWQPLPEPPESPTP